MTPGDCKYGREVLSPDILCCDEDGIEASVNYLSGNELKVACAVTARSRAGRAYFNIAQVNIITSEQEVTATWSLSFQERGKEANCRLPPNNAVGNGPISKQN
ncbi:hypothetical protein PoB_005721400 [Plakobranchus ocellatus]|uniref:Uncharacterized protein n=1 Tax=Plakobranchus ocellatus TaxID=259542 RepID=A0AAV4CDL5_9GAST|nr:hypothetical protein PoB_005721400 [Plakobranchus ocellatus]